MNNTGSTEADKKTGKASEPEQVDAFMKQLKHPKAVELAALREIIIGSHKKIGETIAWNAPAFFYTGKMKPFKPKEYKRFLVVSNFFRRDCIRLIFLKAGSLPAGSEILTGDYADGRRLAFFYSMDEISRHKKALQTIIKKLIIQLEKEE